MKVQPIIEIRDIKRIKRNLGRSPRNLLLFVMGINSGLRVQDLLSLRVDDVCHAGVGSRIEIVEKKTGKVNVLIVNAEIHAALEGYLGWKRPSVSREYLFKSRKGWNYPLTTYAVTHYVQNWCDEIKLAGNYGAHTLRKTWAYQQRKQFGVPWEVIAKRLNHSNPAVTRRYMGVQAEEVEEVLLHVI